MLRSKRGGDLCVERTCERCGDRERRGERGDGDRDRDREGEDDNDREYDRFL